jgi:hypothetical protein
MLFARGMWSRATIGLRLDLQTTESSLAGRSSHGIAVAAAGST